MQQHYRTKKSEYFVPTNNYFVNAKATVQACFKVIRTELKLHTN